MNRKGGRVRWLAAAAIVSAGCTIWVNGITKDYGTLCKFGNRDTPPCGTCIRDKCQDKVTPLCNAESDTTLYAIQRCSGDPSPQNNTSCADLLSEEGGTVSGTGAVFDEHNAKVCVRDNCANECTTCVVTDLPSDHADCAHCILDNCSDQFRGPS